MHSRKLGTERAEKGFSEGEKREMKSQIRVVLRLVLLVLFTGKKRLLVEPFWPSLVEGLPVFSDTGILFNTAMLRQTTYNI